MPPPAESAPPNASPSPGALGVLAKPGIHVAAWIVIALLLAFSFSVDLAATGRDGAVDFRNRITGARLLAHGIDPYHFLWHPGDPPQYCDLRNNPRMTVSKTTVTPAFLVFYLPLAALPYRVAQYLWLLMQWALLLGTLWLWVRTAANAWSALVMALFVTAFTSTFEWRWEAERGQCYTLLLLGLAWWLARTCRAPAGGEFASGFLAGLLVALRPPFLMLAPFIVLHRRAQLGGMAAGLLFAVGLPMLFHPAIWVEYGAAMQTNSDYYRHASTPPRPDQNFPDVIEGIPVRLLGNMSGFPFLDLTVYAVARRLGDAPLSANLLLGGFALLFALWLGMTRAQAHRRLLPALAAWLFLADFVLPTIRWGYYDVLFLNVLLAGIALSGRLTPAMWPSLLALPAAWWLEITPQPSMAMMSAPALLLAGTAVLFLFPKFMPPSSSRDLGVQYGRSRLLD